MARYTNEDFARVLEHLKRAARTAGIQREVFDYRSPEPNLILTADDMQLVKGSATYGRAWRIVYVHPTHGGHYDTQFPALGHTPTEAMTSLQALWQGIYAANQAAEVQRETLASIAETLASTEPGVVWKHDAIVKLMEHAGLVSASVEGVKVI